jgi:hypothetical protein
MPFVNDTLCISELPKFCGIMANHMHVYSIVAMLRLYTSPCIFLELGDQLLPLLFP